MDEKALEAAARAMCAPFPPDEVIFLGGYMKRWESHKESARLAITAYLAALSPGSTGSAEGMVLVPREPTLAMCNAGWREIDKQGFQTEDIEVAPIYRALLSAAGGRDEE